MAGPSAVATSKTVPATCPCPCTVSFDAGADTERCHAVLIFHVDTGAVDDVDVSDRTWWRWPTLRK